MKGFGKALTVVALVCSVPQDGLWAASAADNRNLAKNLLEQMEEGDGMALIDHLNDVSESFQDPDNDENTLAEVRAFIKAFLKETNAKYHLNLTLTQVCQLIRENLDAFEIPMKDQADFLVALEAIESGDSNVLKAANQLAFHWSWDWIVKSWRWFFPPKETSRLALNNQISGADITVFTLLCAVAVVTVCVAPASASGVVPAVSAVASKLFGN